jgi:hypothetical protein
MQNNYNLKFYIGDIRFEPNGIYFEELLSKINDLNYLEENHSYIQWLFPVETQGQNSYSYKINDFEINVCSKF